LPTLPRRHLIQVAAPGQQLGKPYGGYTIAGVGLCLQLVQVAAPFERPSESSFQTTSVWPGRK